MVPRAHSWHSAQKSLLVGIRELCGVSGLNLANSMQSLPSHYTAPQIVTPFEPVMPMTQLTCCPLTHSDL